MTPPKVRRPYRISRSIAGILLLWICGLGLVPVGYGQAYQAYQVSRLLAALKHVPWYDRDSMVKALVEIGVPAVDPLIAALKDDKDWKVRQGAAEALGEIEDPRAVDVLLAGWRKRDLVVIAGAYSFFIQRGEWGSEDVLIQALDANGNKGTAEAFLNCGNSALETAARKWVKANGYQIVPGSGGGHVRWGSRR